MNQFNLYTTTLWLTFIAYWVITAFFAKRSMRGVAVWRGIACRALLVIAVAALCQAPIVEPVLEHVRQTLGIAANPFVVGAGVAICALGLAFAVWARTHLGRNWGVPMSLRQEHVLVTSGPYALARHPIYGGIVVALFGTGLAEGPLTLVLTLVFFLYFVFCVKVEERDLIKRFPNEYLAYRARTKVFVPFLG